MVSTLGILKRGNKMLITPISFPILIKINEPNKFLIYNNIQLISLHIAKRKLGRK